MPQDMSRPHAAVEHGAGHQNHQKHQTVHDTGASGLAGKCTRITPRQLEKENREPRRESKDDNPEKAILGHVHLIWRREDNFPKDR